MLDLSLSLAFLELICWAIDCTPDQFRVVVLLCLIQDDVVRKRLFFMTCLLKVVVPRLLLDLLLLADVCGACIRSGLSS